MSNFGMRRGSFIPVQSDEFFAEQAHARAALEPLLHQRAAWRATIKRLRSRLRKLSIDDSEFSEVAHQLASVVPEHDAASSEIRTLTRKYGLQSMDDDIP